MGALIQDKIEERLSRVFEINECKLFGILHLPHGIEKTPPLVVSLHGFASSKVGTNRSHVLLGEALSKVGIATLRFDYRGHGDSEGDAMDFGLKDYLSDALEIISRMQREGFSEIGLYGSSFGGSLASLAAHHLPALKALALWAPVASGELWARDFMVKSGQSELTNYRGLSISHTFREQFLKMKAAHGISCEIPLLHLMGDQDEVLSLDHRRAFEAARIKLKSESRFLLYPNTSHYLGKSAVMPEVIKEVVAWFSRHLENDSKRNLT